MASWHHICCFYSKDISYSTHRNTNLIECVWTDAVMISVKRRTKVLKFYSKESCRTRGRNNDPNEYDNWKWTRCAPNKHHEELLFRLLEQEKKDQEKEVPGFGTNKIKF